MILQSIAPEARSSATDYVAAVADVRKTEVRQCPMPNARCPMPDAQCPMPNARCPMPDAQRPMPLLPKKMREQSTIADCPRLPIL
ncbi:hypothetical protein QT979_15950 [Microcoleus sp. w2-18bC1]|uniref:hypothetical protein n=1 Tax=unclassified Microcoleus TaxID=2642155 RepID=UPI002FD2C078